jgi:cysteine-rich repeat protein
MVRISLLMLCLAGAGLTGTGCLSFEGAFDRDDEGDDPNDGSGLPLQLCGNGILEIGETCDDGNRTDGDGCSASCQIAVKVRVSWQLSNRPASASRARTGSTRPRWWSARA